MRDRDVAILFATRTLRLFAFGALSVVLVLYLAAEGIEAGTIGLILMLALVGDAAITLWLTTHADRLGRRRVLVAGAALVVATGVVFAVSADPLVLGLVALVGVISPNGNEVGPFLAVEQASLAQVVGDRRRTRAFGWYQLIGSFATAAGALAGGGLATVLESGGAGSLEAYRSLLVAYSLIGLVIAILAGLLTQAVEAPVPTDQPIARRLGLHRSQRVVTRLSALFALDALGGGFVMQTLIAFWLATRFGADAAALGSTLFAANVVAGLSGLVAARLGTRIGLINTMVLTHLPSNLLLMAVPFMPTLEAAVAVLLARFAISQMDVPTRQSYTMAVVAPDERSAAAGVTGFARSLGAAVAPVLAAPLYAAPGLSAVPFLVGGGLKVAYDLLLYRAFRSVRPPEERAPVALSG